MRLQIPRDVVRLCLAKPGNLSRSGNGDARYSSALPIHVFMLIRQSRDVQIGEIARDLDFLCLVRLHGDIYVQSAFFVAANSSGCCVRAPITRSLPFGHCCERTSRPAGTRFNLLDHYRQIMVRYAPTEIICFKCKCVQPLNLAN